MTVGRRGLRYQLLLLPTPDAARPSDSGFPRAIAGWDSRSQAFRSFQQKRRGPFAEFVLGPALSPENLLPLLLFVRRSVVKMRASRMHA
jgi:hypothetical protein